MLNFPLAPSEAARLLLHVMHRRALGGPGSGDVEGHEFHGNQWTTGFGKSSAYDPPRDEVEKQEKLARAQTHSLAHPDFVYGMDDAVPEAAPAVHRYVAAYGQAFDNAPLPDDVELGPMGQCYANATNLVMRHPELTYAEGFASAPSLIDGQPLVFAHGWAVTPDGKVVDPTWPYSIDRKYFGVKYDRKTLLQHLYRSRLYGVLTGDKRQVARVLKTAAKTLRLGKAEDKTSRLPEWPHVQ